MKRRTNFELLRIVAMIMILFHHLACHSSFVFDGLSIGRLWINLISIGGKIGVSLFILITGYFMIEKEKLKVSKLVKLWLELLFYDLLIYFIFVIFKLTSFNIKDLIFRFMPITNREWWFASTYFVLILFTPLINVMLDRISKETYKKYLIIGFICFSIIPTFINRGFESNNLIWFIYIYSVGAYIRLYENDFKYRSGECILCSLILLILTYILKTCLDISSINILNAFSLRLYDLKSFALFAISLFMFIGFKNMNIKDNDYINIIAKATFGVYLIHDNNFVRPYLWNFINAPKYTNSVFIIIYSILIVIVIYIICTIIELLRIKFIEEKYMKKINNIFKKNTTI